MASHLRTAPGSHVAAFLLLHELTAIAPLLGLFGAIHYAGEQWVPLAWVGDRFGPQLSEGMARAERYCRKKGWFGLERTATEDKSKDAIRTLEEDEGGYRVVAEMALAYALTKALLPLRIVTSLWATPWLARGLVRAQGVFRRFKQ